MSVMTTTRKDPATDPWPRRYRTRPQLASVSQERASAQNDYSIVLSQSEGTESETDT